MVGQGTYGDVFLHPEDPHAVVKRARTAEDGRCVRHEARILSSLSGSPGVQKLLHFSARDEACLVSEWAGETLGSLLRQGELTLAEKIDVFVR